MTMGMTRIHGSELQMQMLLVCPALARSNFFLRPIGSPAGGLKTPPILVNVSKHLKLLQNSVAPPYPTPQITGSGSEYIYIYKCLLIFILFSERRKITIIVVNVIDCY